MRSCLAILILLTWAKVLKASAETGVINEQRKQLYEKYISKKVIQIDKADICSRPAAEYLKGNKDLSQCQFLKNWISSFESESIQVGFASAYSSNPASAFGHLFLLFDSKTRRRYLQFFVNYAADIEEDAKAVKYVFGGLGGGFQGTFAIGPFYSKVEEYANFENRDIWLYRLNLTSEQVYFAKILLFEMLQMKSKYYFMDGNCAFEIETFLNVVKPSAKSSIAVLYNSPMATIKRLSNRIGITESLLLNSLKKQYLTQKNNLSDKEKLQLDKKFNFSEASTNLLKAKVLRNEYELRKNRKLDKVDFDNTQLELAKRKFTAEPDELIVGALEKYNNPLASAADKKLTVQGSKSDDISISLAFYDHGLLDKVNGYDEGQQVKLLTFNKKLNENEIAVKLIDMYSLREFTEPDWPISYKLTLDVSPYVIGQLAVGLSFKWHRLIFYDLPGIETKNLQGAVVNEFGLVYSLTEMMKFHFLRKQNFNLNSITYLYKYQLNFKKVSSVFVERVVVDAETENYNLGLAINFD